jgi:hypothetical protein
MDKYIEDGGAGDWGTDKARAKLQQDSPGQKIKRKEKMKRFRDMLEGVDEVVDEVVVEAKDWYSFNTKKLATDFAKAVKDKNADDGDLDKWLDGFAKKSGIKPKDRKMDQDIANDIVFDLAKMGYKKIDAYDLNTFEVDESVKEVKEAMSPADKAKRLKMIKQAVEKMNKGNMERAKKDALRMMKDSGMFDEELEEAAPKMKKIGFYGSEIGGLRQGNKYYSAKAVEVKGKIGYRVTDEFGSFETIDLKTFAKRFG